ncbi:2-oxoacid dehydrogenase acyltransferase, catalytic domain [Dillenia turbinata]|uniref:dihydrolipoyllysine-residue succinyltransferase n=1 Tax=Dillenia turbinata TaxID=194707 RepID=A0AAN8ZRH7_9MAGN
MNRGRTAESKFVNSGRKGTNKDGFDEVLEGDGVRDLAFDSGIEKEVVVEVEVDVMSEMMLRFLSHCLFVIPGCFETGSEGSGRGGGGGEEYVMMELGSGREEHSRGLVVPVIRNADRMNFADIEKEINTLAKKANDGSISMDEMAGSTFTISNGGVYGSLLSIPIINPPQVCHPIHRHSRFNCCLDDVLCALVPFSNPWYALALTYDHRLIDGREAVFFLRRIKDVVEDPRRLLLDI